MRVLWIASRGGLYKQNAVTGTAGWVGALQNVLLETQKDLKLAIVFPHDTDETPLVEGNVTYYPVLNNYGKAVFISYGTAILVISTIIIRW